MTDATGSRLLRRTRALVPMAVALAAAACGDSAQAARPADGSASLAPATGANPFSHRAPAAGGEPRDTLRMLRSLGDTSTFGGISRIAVAGNRLLVLDFLMDPHLAVVDVASGRVVEHFGRNGAGPREFKRPHWAFAGERDSEVWVFDPGNLRLSLLDLDADPDRRVRRSITIPAEAAVESPTWIGGRLVGNGVFPDYTLLVMDERGTPVRRIAAAQPFPYEKVGHWVGVGMLNRTHFASAPSGNRLVTAYQWDDRLDFFSADGALLGTARGPRSSRASYRIQDGKFFWNEETVMAYWAVAASDRHVFALYAGPAPEKPFEHHPSRVHVFTWNGEFVRELAFDRPVYGITVASDGRTVYAPYNDDAGHQLIGVWQVPSSVLSHAARAKGRGAAEHS